MIMIKKYIIANWKMNFNLKQVGAWITEFRDTILISESLEIILAPSFLHLELAKKSGFSLAAQNVSLYKDGAHTGEVSSFQIQEYCKYCIVGHSERGELVSEVLKKRDQCLANNITPIVCFKRFEDAAGFYSHGILLAWEDPDSISRDGIYRAKNIDEIKEVFSKIRSSLPKEAIVVYGGSVNSDNISSLVKLSGLDGVLVGHASLDPKQFANIGKALLDSHK